MCMGVLAVDGWMDSVPVPKTLSANVKLSDVIERLFNGVRPPTMPSNVVAPVPVFIVRLCTPLVIASTVEPNVRLPPPVVNTVSATSTTGPE